MLNRIGKDRRGQDLTEYAVLVCMVALVIYGWLPSNYAPALNVLWQKVVSAICVSLGPNG